MQQNDCFILMSKQGKVRFSSYSKPTSPRDRLQLINFINSDIIPRDPLKSCNVVNYKDTELIYRRYASLYFIVGVGMESTKNELLVLD